MSTFVIVALQDSRKVFVFLWPSDCVSLDFFQGVGRGWPFLSFWPIIFSFSPRRWFVMRSSLAPGGFFFRFFFLVPWMLVDIRLVYIYIYMCVCVCVCVWIFIEHRTERATVARGLFRWVRPRIGSHTRPAFSKNTYGHVGIPLINVCVCVCEYKNM